MGKFLLFFGGILGLFVAVSILLIIDVKDDPIVGIDPAEYIANNDRLDLIVEIKKRGAGIAYQDFIEDNNNAPVSIQHIRAHVIGEALFETIGVDGITVCDSSFGFGCFHGLFTAGFSSEGRGFVKEADAMCVERYGVLGTGCQHGIGHGIIEYVGHSKLNEALALCEETSQPTPLLGCTSGVFMEHNTPFTILPGVDTLPPYPFSDERPYAACEDVPSKYGESCYYELGGWWETVLKGNKIKMGELCAGIHDKRLRDNCALGVGNIIGPTNEYDIERSSRICSQMPESIITLCHAGAAWSMFSNPEHKEKAELMCGGLNDLESNMCLETYNLAGQLPN